MEAQLRLNKETRTSIQTASYTQDLMCQLLSLAEHTDAVATGPVPTGANAKAGSGSRAAGTGACGCTATSLQGSAQQGDKPMTDLSNDEHQQLNNRFTGLGWNG